MSGMTKISKTKMDQVLNNYNVYTNVYDAKNETNAVSNVLPQWWGDEGRDLELDLNTGIVWETQEDGEKVGMGALDEHGIRAIQNNDPNKRRVEQRKIDQMIDEDKKAGGNSTPNIPKEPMKEESKGTILRSNSVPEASLNKKEEVSPVAKAFNTAGNAVVATVEGVGALAESLVDAAAIGGNILSTPGSAVLDAGLLVGNMVGNKMSYKEALQEVSKNGFIAKSWEDTKGFVSKEYVSSAFDKFYDNTVVGQAMKNDSYGYKAVRSGAKTVGKIAGIAAITVATMGIGGAAAGGSAAGGSAAGSAAASAAVGTEVATTAAVGTEVAVGTVGAASVGTEVAVAASSTAVGAATATTGAAAATATATGAGAAATTAGAGLSSSTIFTAVTGASGFGEGAQNSWANGASTARGLTAGAVKGGVDAALTGAGIGVINSGLSNGAKIAANTAVGGAGGMLDPLSKAIGNNTSYKQEFDNAGGIKTVAMDAAIAGAGTAFVLKGAKQTTTPYGEEGTAGDVAGAIEDKSMNVNSSQAYTESTTSQPTSGTSQSSAPLGIEDKAMNASAQSASQTTAQANPTSSTTSTSTGATQNATTSNTSSTTSSTSATAAASAAQSSWKSTSGFSAAEKQMFNEASEVVARRGGVGNLSSTQRQEIAKSLGVTEQELLHLDRPSYIKLLKKVHSDNFSDDTTNIVQVLNKFYEFGAGK